MGGTSTACTAMSGTCGAQDSTPDSAGPTLEPGYPLLSRRLRRLRMCFEAFPVEMVNGVRFSPLSRYPATWHLMSQEGWFCKSSLSSHEYPLLFADNCSDTRLNSQSLYPSPFTIAYREQLSRMEITLSPRKLLWRITPLFKLIVRRKRNQLFKHLRPFITKGINTDNDSPRTIIRSAVEEYTGERGVKGTAANNPDEAFIEQVFYQLMIFFFGGDDALSITIPRVFRQLQLNPECVAKLQAEHDAILGSDPSLAAEKIREAPHILDSLQYTLGVIKETLRMNPATITIREGQPSFNLKINGEDEPWPTDGFDLFDSSITIHHDPANFVDPLKFIPERFSALEGDRLHPAKNIWRGFQLGPRKCIGQELAVVVLKLVLVFTVRSFDIEMAWDKWDKVRELQGLKVDRRTVEGERMYTTGKATSHPKDGAPMHVRMRTSVKE